MNLSFDSNFSKTIDFTNQQGMGSDNGKAPEVVDFEGLMGAGSGFEPLTFRL